MSRMIIFYRERNDVLTFLHSAMHVYARIVDSQAALYVQFASTDSQSDFLSEISTAECANHEIKPVSLSLASSSKRFCRWVHEKHVSVTSAVLSEEVK